MWLATLIVGLLALYKQKVTEADLQSMVKEQEHHLVRSASVDDYGFAPSIRHSVGAYKQITYHDIQLKTTANDLLNIAIPIPCVLPM